MISHDREVRAASQVEFALFNGPHNGHGFQLDHCIVRLALREGLRPTMDKSQIVRTLSPLHQAVANAFPRRIRVEDRRKIGVVGLNDHRAGESCLRHSK